MRQFPASASSSASPAPSTTELSPEEFFCLHAPSGGMIGARTLQLIHKSMLDWPQFANNAKVLFDFDVRSLGTAAGLGAFCEQHKTSAKFFDFDSQVCGFLRIVLDCVTQIN